jgi:hypothetical protein
VSVAIAVGAPGGLLVLLGWLFRRDQQRATTARNLDRRALVGVGFAAYFLDTGAGLSAYSVDSRGRLIERVRLESKAPLDFALL